jgi:hypothetical protein
MLPLDSARWRELRQAYGPAHDVPRLVAHLDHVGDADRAELWLGLWATLCGRGAVYTASYATVPHLVAYAGDRGAAERARALHLVGAIEAARHAPDAPAIPDDLAGDYAAAIERVAGRVAEVIGEPWDADTTQILCGVLAVAKGRPRFGSAVLQLEPVTQCPVCGAVHPTVGWEPGVAG